MKVCLPFWLAVALFGCSADDEPFIKFGAIISTTGSMAEMGAFQLEAIGQAAEEINRAGGVRGFQIRIVHRNDAMDPNRALRAVEGMAKDIEPVIIGAVDSKVTAALLEETDPRFLLISPSATAVALSDQHTHLLRTCASQDGMIRLLVQRAKEKGIERMAILYTTDLGDYGLAVPFHTAWQDSGGLITKRKGVSTGRQNYDNVLLSVLDTDPQAILLDANPVDGAELIRSYTINYSARNVFWFFTDRLQLDSFITTVGIRNFSFSHEGIGPSTPDSTAYGEFATAFERRSGYPPPRGAYTANAYDATYLTALGLGAVPQSDVSAIQLAIEKLCSGGTIYSPSLYAEALSAMAAGDDIDFSGASGTLDLDQNGTSPAFFDIWKVGVDGFTTVQRNLPAP